MSLRSKLALLPALACLLTGQAFASQLPVASLRVETPQDVLEEGTNLPVTVKALDADGDVKTDYIGTVYFVVKGDPDPKIPANKAQGYTFQASENGVHLFTQGITFSQPGSTEVLAIDLDNENVQGSKMVTVTPNPCKAASVLISILSPKDGATVSVPKVSVSGATKASCSAQLLLNGTKVADVKADAKGAYGSDVPGLQEGENVITAVLGNGNKSTIRVFYEKDQVVITSPADGSVLKTTSATVTGKTGANKQVTVSTSPSCSAVGTSGADGAFSIPLACLRNGPNTITAVNKTGARASVNVTVDASIVITGPADGSVLTSSSTTVTGRTVPGMAVTVSTAPGCVASGQADAAGNFAIPLACLKKGPNRVTASNAAGASASVNVRLEYAVTITSPKTGTRLTTAPGLNSAPSGSGMLATVTGRAGPNAPVSIRIGKQDICWGTADAKGDFSIPNCPLPSCDVAIVADQRDAQGTTLATSPAVALKVLPAGNVCEQVHFTCLRGARAGGRATLDFCVAPDGPAVASFRVLTGASCEALSGSVDTLPKGKMYGPDWKNYRWWVPSETSAPLAVKVLALDPAGQPTGLPSECLLLDDGKCEIGAITGVRSTADVPSLRSTLTWDPNADSVSYNLYMRPEGGGPLAFVDNAVRPPYLVRMAPDRVKFNDFVVRGVCRAGAKPSADLANATAVQTGPMAWFLLPLALLGAAVALRFAAAKAR